MGNEIMAARDVGRATAVSGDSHAQTQAAATPGKSTLAAALPAAAPYIEQLKQMAGQRVKDGGNYVFEIQPDATFKNVGAPNGYRLVKPIEYGHPAWHVLCGFALLMCIDASVAHAAAPASNPGFENPKFAPISKPSTPEAQAAADRAATRSLQAMAELPAPEEYKRFDADGKPIMNDKTHEQATAWKFPTALEAALSDLGRDDVATVTHTDAYIRDAAEVDKLLPPLNGKRPKVPLATVVRIAELKKTAKGTYALVEQLASPVATRGNQLGWIATSNMRRFERPTRPSSPSTQMAAVLAAARARATRSMGGCYHYVKDAIIVAQGYGDILDINNDPRFSGCLAYATQFKAAIDKYSPAAFGLEQLSGEVASAPPGALVISAGTAKNGIDPRYGDIAVVDGVKDGFTHCYNDGRVRFSTAAKEWKSGGKLENTLLAIYKPIARP